jgi:serpin B
MAPQPFSQADRDRAVDALRGTSAKAVVGANNGFGFRLFAELLRKDPQRNTFISPTSIALALEMTYNGATGATKAAMARTLGVGGASLDQVNEAALNLQTLLRNADPSVDLAIANSLWGNKQVKFKQDFLDRNQRFYGAKLTSLDFASPEAVKTINGWVSDNTRGKIPKIINGIPPDMILYLIDAVYFKGDWQDKFDKAETKDKPFHLASGTTVQHPLMHRTGRYPYLRGKGFEAVALPYGKGKLSMYVFLPDKTSSIEAFLAGLTNAGWEKWMTGFSNDEGSVSIPRFRSEYGVLLNGALQALGMSPAFAGGFGGMGSDDWFISEVNHKTYVNMDEEGTEAAAATEVGIEEGTIAPSPRQPFNFVADRPFFYSIREADTGAVLFMGVLYDPRR